MPLTAGTRLGPYEIFAPLGAGGMGKGYRVKDTRLDRIVPVKVLSDALAADPLFRVRFDREARANVNAQRSSYVPSRDGQKLLVSMVLESAVSSISVVTNWTAEVKAEAK